MSLALSIVAAFGAPAMADEVAVVGGGPIHLRKRTPRLLQDTVAVGRVEAGYRVHPRGVARVRLEGLAAEGLNLFCDLVAEVELGPAYGLQGFAGLSYSEAAGAGNHVGIGAFVRREMSPSLALRADSFAAGVIRTDFAGVGIRCRRWHRVEAAAMRRWAALTILVCAGCPPEKPVVELPAPSGALRAERVTLSLDPAPRDIRVLRIDGRHLFVGDSGGLWIYDVTEPASPRLLGRVAGAPVDDLAVLGTTVILLEIAAAAPLRAFDIAVPASPRATAEIAATTLTFGGIAARQDLVWHAVGSNPPSTLFTGPDLARGCDGPDVERGAIGVWMDDRFAYETVHFDDYAGDGLDGNGAYGVVSYRIDQAGECPRVTPIDIFFFDTHSRNRSQFERSSAGDLQLAFLDGELFATGEQQVRRLAVDGAGRFTERAAVPVPDAIQVTVDATGPCGAVVAVGNGDVVLICADEDLEVAAVVTTPGVTRELAAVGDGRHLFVDDDAGLSLIRYEVP